MFDTIALWTGRVLLITIAWAFIAIVWYIVLRSYYNVHSNFCSTRRFALEVKPNEFVQWLREQQKKDKKV